MESNAVVRKCTKDIHDIYYCNIYLHATLRSSGDLVRVLSSIYRAFCGFSEKIEYVEKLENWFSLAKLREI